MYILYNHCVTILTLPQLLDNELARELKKEPVVEYKIPKHIFSSDEVGLNTLGQLMTQVIKS
jgi:U3 small nucleolar RNA-associated protein 19